MWSLYKIDDLGLFDGGKLGGWSITITTQPDTFTYQGQLRLAGALVNGPADFRFSLFQEPSGGTPLVTIARDDVPVTQGRFTVELQADPSHLTVPELWLEIAVRAPAGSGDFMTLAPRQWVTPAPLALRSFASNIVPWAGIVDLPPGFADGVDNGEFSLDAVDGFPTQAVFVDAAGQVGIGTLEPEGRLHVLEFAAENVTAHPASVAVFERIAQNYVSILSDDAGERGVVFGSPASNVHGGIYYTNAAGMNFRTGGNNSAMTIFPNGNVGIGVPSETPQTPRLTVRGSGSTGDVWISPSVGGGNADILLTENASGSFGMIIRHDGASNLTEFIGLQNGVENPSPALTIARTTAGGVTVTNNLNVGGTLTKGGGAFKIDHPLDPENKYLYHSYVESPDMKNIYDGVVTTDAAGAATITLPEWFGALNRDFRYQLTIIDERPDLPDTVTARVVRKIRDGDNTFTIRTSVPGVEVSWQVTGIRRDAFAEANRIPLEQDKPPHARGTYLHPEAWGKPTALREPAPPEPVAAK